MPLQRRTKKKTSRAGTGTFYNASDIRDLFFAETGQRQAKKISNDGTYWTGGQCRWGGSHNLDEDAQTLAKFLNKIGELDNAKVELMDCAERSEFDLTKQKLIAQCDEAINGLKANTGAGTSIGGICIIWGDFLSFLENVILSKFRKEFSRLKQEISQTTYDESKELAKLDIEQEKAELEIMENQRKANEEKDPSKKAIFLELVEDNKKKLQEITDKKKKIPLNNLGGNFDIRKHIEELINATKKDQVPNQNSTNTPKNKNANSGSNGSRNTSQNTSNGSNNNSNPTTNNQGWFQENKQLILIAGATCLIILYLYSQQNTDEYLESNNLYNYNF